MQLTVLHYHYRPGGVRRVIETGLPELARAGGFTRVVMAGGEAPEEGWRRALEAALFPCEVKWVIEPVLGYWSGQSGTAAEVAGGIRETLRGTVDAGGVLWAHNLSVGRNLLLLQEVAALPGGIWLHHHDWWWDGRWERWPEMEQQGITSLPRAMSMTLPGGERVRHFCINAADARRVREWSGLEAGFIPNPMVPERVSGEEVARAREFLRGITGRERVWLYPCRALRRKNLAEALLVQRWLAPEAALVTTGGVSSAEEAAYFEAVKAGAERTGGGFYPAVCDSVEVPPVPALIAAAGVVAVTSLREGFGLPYQEAAAAGRPLLARIPPGVEETMGAMGFRFRSAWRTLRVPRQFYDGAWECSRLEEGKARLEKVLPEELRCLLERRMVEDGEDIDFGRLTLPAQLEVLDHPPEFTLRACLAGNPVLGLPLNPQPSGSPWTPAQWAAAMLDHGRGTGTARAFSPEWSQEAAGLLMPLVQSWLEHPLLW